MKRKIPPRLGTLREGDRFPTDEEFPQCVEVECPTCHSRGYALPDLRHDNYCARDPGALMKSAPKATAMEWFCFIAACFSTGAFVTHSVSGQYVYAMLHAACVALQFYALKYFRDRSQP